MVWYGTNAGVYIKCSENRYEAKLTGRYFAYSISFSVIFIRITWGKNAEGVLSFMRPITGIKTRQRAAERKSLVHLTLIKIHTGKYKTVPI